MKRKAKILYIEDNPLTQILTRKILEQSGYEVSEADDGLSGVSLALAERPDLVLMDINMPGLNGYEATTQIKSLPGMENTIIVAYTAALTSPQQREQLLAAGCDGYISKTLTPDELLEQIGAYLQGKRDTIKEERLDAGAQANQERLVNRLEEQVKKLTQANRELKLLNHVAQALTSTLNLKELLSVITQKVEITLEVESCSLLLIDETEDELVFAAASGRGARQLVGHRLSSRQGIVGWVIREKQSVLVNDVRRDPRFFEGIDEMVNYETRSVICVPLRVKSKIIGVIEAINKIEGQFDQSSLQLLDSLASTAALAIENARLYSDLQAERDHLIKKEEEIRRGIARDLHDGPTQMVSAISMNVEFIKKLKEKAPERLDKELESLQALANEATNDIRNLLFGLHPTILETQGLPSALEIYVERFFDRSGMVLSLDMPPDMEASISKEAEIVAFIIIQEAVNNARKHAEASEVVIKLRQTNDLFVIIIQDNGKGFDVNDTLYDYDQRVSFGLSTMSERARLVNAKYKLHSKPGHGTSVILGLPLTQTEVHRNGSG